MNVDHGVDAREARIEELERALVEQKQLIERLGKRVLSKDREFQLERDAWRRKEREYQKTIRGLRRGPPTVSD